MSRINQANLFAVTLILAIVLAAWVIPDRPGNEVYVGVIAVLVVAIFAFIRFRLHQKKERPLKEKIQQMRERGEVLSVEEEKEVTAADLNVLRKYRRFTIFAYSAGILVLSGSTVFFLEIAEVPYKLIWRSLVLVLSGGGGIYGWLAVKRHDELVNKGKKTVLRGVITNKFTDSSGETDSYELEIDRINVYVNKRVFKRYEIGDAIELHLFKPLHNLVLFETKLGEVIR